MKFFTNFKFKNREEKAKYVWLKYQEILKSGKILDVGAGERYLKKYIKPQSRYLSVGLDKTHEIITNLEEKLPLKTKSFDCVLCLDVLEHLENIYQAFNELCRVTDKYLIISLPNSWFDFILTLKRGYYDDTRSIKYYNLPIKPPKDRHRWFLNTGEAENFLRFNGEKNKMRVLQIDFLKPGRLKMILLQIFYLFFINKKIPIRNFTVQSVWAVLEKIK